MRRRTTTAVFANPVLVGAVTVLVVIVASGGHVIQKVIELSELGDVAANAGDVAANRLDRSVELGLPATRDEDLCAFRHEALRRGQAETAATAGDECHFARKFQR